MLVRRKKEEETLLLFIQKGGKCPFFFQMQNADFYFPKLFRHACHLFYKPMHFLRHVHSQPGDNKVTSTKNGSLISFRTHWICTKKCPDESLRPDTLDKLGRVYSIYYNLKLISHENTWTEIQFCHSFIHVYTSPAYTKRPDLAGRQGRFVLKKMMFLNLFLCSIPFLERWIRCTSTGRSSDLFPQMRLPGTVASGKRICICGGCKLTAAGLFRTLT